MFTNLKNFLDEMARNHTPGNAVMVYRNGELAYQYASGFASLEEQKPLTGDEFYYIYSCSKVALATAGMQLLERGVFKMCDPLYAYIPEFRHMQVRTRQGLMEAQNPMTVGQLFTMTAGLDYDLNTPGIQKARELTGGKMNTAQVVRCMASDPLIYEPGSHWQYSKAHDVLAGLIEILSGKPFREYMKENIFDPLDMKDTCYHPTQAILDRMAEQYEYIPQNSPGISDPDVIPLHENGGFRNRTKKNDYILGCEYDSGGAGVITTLGDYAKLTAALGNGGTGLNGNRILSPFTVNLMKTNTLTPAQSKDYNWETLLGCGYGYGVRTHIDPALSGVNSSVGEFGWGGAAGATVIADTEQKLGVFYVQHCLNPREEWYQPRLRNVVYSCL